MPRTKKDIPHPVDIFVGNKVKNRRLMLGMSQDDLAKSCGITFQQVQKYERGTNRISISRLAEISLALKTQLEHFTEGCFRVMPGGKQAKGFSDTKQSSFEPESMSRDVAELVRAYQSISETKLKKQLLEMAKAMAKTGNNT